LEKESTRNYGIDLLRLFAMYLIVVLHVLGQGGVLNSENAVGTRYAVAWFLEICAYCSVDCYALISGYVGYRDRETPYRYSKFLSFWVPVFFYSLGIALVAALVDPDAVNAERMWKSVFPVTTSRYWYITAYAGLFFVIPWLNRLLRGCTDRELTRVAIGIFVIFCCFNAVSIVYGGGLSLAGGYSFVWLALLYVLGACLKRTGIVEKFRSRVWLLAAFLAVLVTWLFKVFMPTRPVNDALISYTSPTITLVAVALLAVFSRLRPQGIWRKLIGFFAPAALGVYLIHVHWYIFYFPLNNALPGSSPCGSAIFPSPFWAAPWGYSSAAWWWSASGCPCSPGSKSTS
jgi:surface polysaccharide O-acyltransferase-like enzyme